MNINIAVVPVAGLGTRLLPATKSQPKEMLPVGRKPVVQYVVEELTRVGLEQILFVTGPGKTSIENHFDLNAELIQTLRETGKEELLAELYFERASVQYFYTRQRQLLGLGHAVACARPFVGNQPFVVALGDSIIGMHAQSDIVRRMTECFAANNASAVIAFEEVPRAEVFRYGVAKPKEAGSHLRGEFFAIEDLIEKPDIDEAPSNLAIAARYVFAPAIFDALDRIQPGKGGEIQLTDAVRLLLQEGHAVYGISLGPNEERYDIGNFESYFRAFVDFALADERYGASVRKHLEAVISRQPSIDSR
ncbi:MAG: UTP--glucose-1-phosphate uridylyltransferase [Caldilineaceae bacterium]|nr:UTP--glucose-1-phosphate uridylyltransferase [Caldilineaceae bacterium]MCB0184718.1 UTP--glucose-1-phosphate uridylyltransferase [Caldilineaceae bacterium]